MRRSSAFGQLLQGLGRQAGPGSSSCRAPLQQLQHHQRRAVWQPHHAGPSQAQHLRAFSSSCGSPHPARGTLQPRGPACAGKLSLSARLTSTASPSTPFRGLASRPTTRSSPSQPPSPPSQPPLGRRRTYSSGRPPPKPQVKFWPFVLVIAAGTGAYILLVKYRKDRNTMPPTIPPSGPTPTPAQVTTETTPTFSASDVTVVFVLGGPGAGKGTQCAKLVETYGFVHLSAGDLLRAEQAREGSQYGELIKSYIKDGKIVPMEVTVALLENAMKAEMAKEDAAAGKDKKKAKFLIDGFPRKMDQAVKFEAAVCPAQFVLFFDCPEAELERRLTERGKTSGRADDNAESIRKRFRTFVETSMPVVDYYRLEGRVVHIDATPGVDEVFDATKKEMVARLGDDL